ncbi:MAG: biotin/lipoyl-binding protein [Thermoplasmata archaeon]|nr:biotin/lipoyl-binding protein [Thermoplasmata archaeon]MCI4359921.1 biotin/lipoyl-binding protein [Thermoplasmata archaeon]
MKVTVVIDGETREVDVDLATGTVRVGERTFPMTVVSRSLDGAELDLAGEHVTVRDWPADQPTPENSVTVDGERFAVSVRTEGERASGRPPPAYGPGPSPNRAAVGPVSFDAIVPPMPGRVIELRVRDGQRVEAGEVLLVLEAMKMRNEIQSPRAGVVRDVRVSAGDSVKGREAMLRVVAEP